MIQVVSIASGLCAQVVLCETFRDFCFFDYSNTILELSGYLFAANANIQSSREQLDEIITKLRYKQIRFRVDRYNSTEAEVIAKLIGYGNEWLNIGNPTGEMYKDVFNNLQGRAIGDLAENINDIPEMVRDALDDGELVKDENDPRILDNPDPIGSPEMQLPVIKIPVEGYSPTSCPITPWLQDAMDKMDDAEKLSSPLILDLGATGISLVSVTGPNAVYWDVDNDGLREASGWVGTEDGLLVIDAIKLYVNDNITLQRQVA